MRGQLVKFQAAPGRLVPRIGRMGLAGFYSEGEQLEEIWTLEHDRALGAGDILLVHEPAPEEPPVAAPAAAAAPDAPKPEEAPAAPEEAQP